MPVEDYAPRKKQPDPAPEGRAKIEPVIKSTVVRKKQPLHKRILGTLVGGSLKTAISYTVLDVLVPALKDMAADAGRETIERTLFGESRRASRPSRSTGDRGYVSYNRISAVRPDDNRREISRTARTAQLFDEILLESREEADIVLERLYDLLSQYKMATVADLYDLVGVTSTPQDNKWGWLDLRGARVERDRGGQYLLNLPKPEPID